MGNVKIYGDRVNEAKVAARAMETAIKTTYDRCETLSAYLHSAKWSGKSRDSFVCYLDIIRKYHQDMKSALAKQTKALNNLDRYMEDFNRDPAVKEVRHL